MNYNALFEGCQFPVITEHKQHQLGRPFTAQEIWEAVKSMYPKKAPGPDGCHAWFYQANWKMVGLSITTMLLRCLNDDLHFHELNETFITLIPKIKNLVSMVDFRLINLCNVVYKILSKVLVNHIKPILNALIGDTQSAFVSQQLITDNIIVALEVFHWLNLSRQR